MGKSFRRPIVPMQQQIFTGMGNTEYDSHKERKDVRYSRGKNGKWEETWSTIWREGKLEDVRPGK